MDHNLMKLRVGIFVLMAMIILGILIVVHSDGWNPQYTVFIKPTSAPGVAVGTPVRKNGILIGRVHDVRNDVNPETGREQLVVVLGVNENVRLYENEVCEIGTGSFLGDAVIEVVGPGGQQPLGPVIDPAADANEMIAIAKQDPLEMINSLGDLKPQFEETLEGIKKAGESVGKTAEGIEKLTGTLQTAFDDENGQFQRLVANLNQVSVSADTTLRSWDELFGNLNDIVGDQQVKNDIRSSFAEALRVLGEVRIAVIRTREKVLEIGDNVNGKINELDPVVTSLRDQGPEIIEKVNNNLTEINQLVAQVKSFTENLENFKNSDGTIAKLLNEDEAYDALMESLHNVRDVSVKLDPLMNDLRSFTDAIARDPGSLGVRGALDRRPSKTGYKGSAGRDGGWFNLP